jgi:DNA-binding GntR family transcriptional regulator
VHDRRPFQDEPEGSRDRGTGIDVLPKELGRLPAHRKIANTLRDAILTGRLPGGTPLVQAELAAELGTSSTPVREAIRELAAEGLVRLDPYRRAVVHAPTLEEIRENYEIALLLEPAAVRKAAEAHLEPSLAELDPLLEKMERVESAVEYAELNRNLHRALHLLSGAPQMVELLGRLHDRTALQTAVCLDRGMQSLAQSNKEHRAIVAAITDRLPEQAEVQMREHLQLTFDALSLLIAAAIDGD